MKSEREKGRDGGREGRKGGMRLRGGAGGAEGREGDGGREGLGCEDKQKEEKGVWEGEGRGN